MKQIIDNSRVDLFIKRYREKDYYEAVAIVLSGWGTKEAPLHEYENQLITDFILKTTNSEQEAYINALRASMGIFG